MYIVKWTKEDREPYLVDAGAEGCNSEWAAIQPRARRFKTAALAHYYVAKAAQEWLVEREAKVLRLKPRPR